MKIVIEPIKSRTKSGKCPFRMRIQVGSGESLIRKCFVLKGIEADPCYFDAKHQIFCIESNVKNKDSKARNRQHEEYNAILGEYKAKAKEIIDDFKRKKQLPTVTQMYEGLTLDVSNDNIFEYWQEHIVTLRATGKIGTANQYQRTLEMLLKFKSNFTKLTFGDIDMSFVKRFDLWLQSDRNSKYRAKDGSMKLKPIKASSGNTRRYYMAAVRSILNKAIAESKYDGTAYPFGKDRFEIGALETETAKRYLPNDVMTILKTQPANDKLLERTRRIFVAQYLCYGISFADAAKLTKQNIFPLNDGDYIVYKRAKTTTGKNVRPIAIKITSELKEHLDWFKLNCELVDDYLFPIVSIEGKTGAELYTHIRYRFARNNLNLKQLAKSYGFEGITLTSYVSRHTMAMTLQGKDVPRELISQMLGHTDLKTTQTYLDSFKGEKLGEIADLL